MPVRKSLARGECLQRLASQNGLADGRTIYDFADNGKLRAARSHPAEVAPGDTVVIPDVRPQTLSGGADLSHHYRVRIPRAKLRIFVRDEADRPIAGMPFDLYIGGTTLQGTTASDGLIEQPVSLVEDSAELVVFANPQRDGGRWCWKLQVASLAPSDTPRGAWQRLSNLGYWSLLDPPEDAALAQSEAQATDDAARDPVVLAIRAFQHDAGLDESGRFDDSTCSALAKRHGI